ncbi:MAG TPA: N-6 DNA methylase [Tepidisphaeraceae bacterium]|nr:N-6 DNA methylase [Tepidisphaeraceae bacterium]
MAKNSKQLPDDNPQLKLPLGTRSASKSKRSRRRTADLDRASEVDAYVFIKENLKLLGWDPRSPERIPEGQVYTQNECLSHPAICAALGLQRPENIVKVAETTLWVIEAKRSQGQLAQAISEAEDYARKINKGGKLLTPFISGVAGNLIDGFQIRSRFLVGDKYQPIKINGVEATALLSQSDCALILKTGKPDLDNPPIDEKLFLSRAELINEILHLGAVNPHQRANVMAALLLTMLSDTGVNVEERNPSVLIGDINSRVQSVLRAQGKSEFYEYIKIALPTSQDNHVKFRQALVDTIQELNNLNIRSAMNSGADWLGAFYEVFLKYASWAQDLGIVLTPRHMTRYAADVMDVRPSDIIFDPTCGTGGFLVAAFDAVKKSATSQQISNFKKYSVFGIEQDPGVAALAVVNMIFRGDGKNNIIEGNCFAKKLIRITANGSVTARFAPANPPNPTTPPVTKVMMNPPFALKRSAEKEYKFIDHALEQMEHGGLLFAVLPYSTLVRPGRYKVWRRDALLPHHTVVAVVTLPGDLFYPVAVTTVGLFIRKGTPHPMEQNVLWVRALSDGLLKSKGKRLPSPRAKNDFETVKNHLRAFLPNPSYQTPNIHQLIKAAPLDASDKLLETVPEAYLDQAEPTEAAVIEGMEAQARELFAYLVKINVALLKPELFATPQPRTRPRFGKWRAFHVTELFELKRGHFHSIADLDPGQYATISRVSTDNGLVGFFEKPTKKKTVVVWKPGTITVSTVTGDAFIQPVPFIATDNVVLCVPRKERQGIRLTTLFFVQLMLNFVKWRYSYGRQCYKTKFAATEIMLPVTANDELDEEYMAYIVEEAPYWHLVKAVFDKQKERIGV